MSYRASIECDDSEILAEHYAAKLAARRYCDVWGEDGHRYDDEDSDEYRAYCQCGAHDPSDRGDERRTFILADDDDQPPF